MTAIHFTSRTINNGEEVYDLTINGKPYTYNRGTDFLENMRTGDLIERPNLPGDTLKAFHQAWDPEYYAAAVKETPTLYGIPCNEEDPTSPLYNPQRPSGYPLELRTTCEAEDQQQDMAALIALAYAAGHETPDWRQLAAIAEQIDRQATEGDAK